MKEIISELKNNPVIAAIRTKDEFNQALLSHAKLIFILSADIFTIPTYIRKIRNAGKLSYIHVDFLEGFGKDKKAIDYIAKKLQPDGIISTRSNVIAYAKNVNISTIQRFFIVDSQSLATCIHTINHAKPDMVEIMPGLMPEIIEKICHKVHTPVIVGGLISKKEEVTELLHSGAIGISTGEHKLW